MGFCRDDVTNYLASLGYNVVRIPAANLFPLQLIGLQGGSSSVLGGLNALVTSSSGALPVIGPDEPAPDVSGHASSKMSAKIGLNLLGGFLSALGANASVSAQYSQAKSVQFRFREVLKNTVLPLDVGAFLRNGEVDEGNPILTQYVLGNGDLFVITETLKTKDLLVSADDKSGTAVDVELPAIQSAVGASVTVGADTAQDHVISYAGAAPLVFGFKAYRVGVFGGQISLVQSGPDVVALDAATQPTIHPSLLAQSSLLDLRLG